MTKLHNMRKEFGNYLESELNLPPNPFSVFKIWFEEAKKHYVKEANSFVLSTVSAKNSANSRVILLKDFDDKSFTFFTNYKSTKAQEIENNPMVSCNFYWPSLEKQIIIKAKAKKISYERSNTYFKSRPKNSQIAAWASTQSQEIKSKKELILKFLGYKKQFANQHIECPEFWGGYDLTPLCFEFWQGGQHRLHDRIIYQLNSDKSWQQSRLSP